MFAGSAKLLKDVLQQFDVFLPGNTSDVQQFQQVVFESVAAPEKAVSLDGLKVKLSIPRG